MAYATKPVAKVIISMVDATGSRSSVEAYLPGATLAAQAITDGEALAVLLADLSDCQIETVSVTYAAVDPVAAVAIDGSSIEEKGVFSFVTAAGKFNRMSIPAIKDAVVDEAGAIPTSGAEAAALITEMLTTHPWCDSNGSDLVNIHSAYKRYRNSTKHMLPSDRLVA